MAGLVTLTPQQFAAHPASRKPGASYSSYLRFVNKRRAAKLGAVAADPLAPTPEPQLRQQTTEAVRAQIDPIVAEIMGSTKQAAKGIDSLTSTYASRLEPFEGAARARYGRAAEGTAAVAESLANRLEDRGGEEAAGLQGKLAQINAPDRLTSEIAGATTGFAKGAANAGFAVDSAALDEILGHGATAEDFAGTLPGLARLTGLRATGDLQREGQRQIGEVRGKIPGLVGELMESGRDREVNKGIAKLGLQETQIRTDAETAAAAAQAQADAVEAADKSAQAWAKIQQAGERLTLSESKTSFDQAVKNSKLGLDEKQYRLAMQREARLAKAPGKKTGGFTAGQKQNMAEQAYDTALDDIDDSDLKPVDTLRFLIGKGIPFSIAVKAMQRATKATPNADNYWKATIGWTK